MFQVFGIRDRCQLTKRPGTRPKLNLFSVQPLLSLCLSGGVLSKVIHHKDTENTEVAQRNPD